MAKTKKNADSQNRRSTSDIRARAKDDSEAFISANPQIFKKKTAKKSK